MAGETSAAVTCAKARSYSAAASFLKLLLSHIIDQNAPHQLGANAKELRAILPIRFSLVYELKVNIAYERRRLQGVTGTFLTEKAHGAPMQLVVNQREQLFERLAVASFALTQPLGDLVF